MEQNKKLTTAENRAFYQMALALVIPADYDASCAADLEKKILGVYV